MEVRELLDLEDDLLLTLAFVITEDQLPTHAIHRHSKIVWKPPFVSAVSNLVAFSSTCKQMQELLRPQLRVMMQQLLEQLRAKSKCSSLRDQTLLLFSSALLPPSPPEQLRRRSSMPGALPKSDDVFDRDEMFTSSDIQGARYRALRTLHAPRRLSLPTPPARVFSAVL